MNENTTLENTLNYNLKLLFPNIIKLIRIIICKPVSSVTCEHSFSGLRRLKTWMRNSMSNERLNNLLLCHVHKELLNEPSKQ